MSKSTIHMIEELEDLVGLECPGQKIAISWYRYLSHTPSILNWLYAFESIRPNALPFWMDPYFEKIEMSLAMEKWQRYRKDNWERGYWTTMGNSSSVNDLTYQQCEGDPDLPAEFSSRRLFGEILAALPIKIFEWAHSYMELMEKSETFYQNYSHAKWGLRRPAGEFMFIESRANFWRGRNGVRKISEIALPGWAKFVNQHKHHLEGGHLPPFEDEYKYPEGLDLS